MQDVDLDEIARRPQRYWNVDGLPELMMGLLWVLWGGAWIVGERLPRNGWYNAYWLVVPACLMLSCFATVWATRYLKSRVTFPRTGYVAWRSPTLATRLFTAGVAIVTAMALAAAVVKTKNDAPASQMAAPVLGVILSLAFLVASVRQHAPHYLALAGVAVALGLALGAGQGGWESVNWLFLGLGVATSALGAFRLVLFLRRYPRQTLEGA